MQPIFKIISFTKKFWKWYLLSAVFIVSVSLLSLVGPLLSKQIVDIIVAKITHKPFELTRLYWILGFILFADIAISVLNAVGQWIGDLFTVRLQTFLSREFYEHILSLHIGYYDNEIAGRIVNKLYRGIESIVDFVKNMINNFLPFFLTALVTILLLAHYSVVIAMLLAVLFPLYIVISNKSSISWQRHQGKMNAISDDSQGRVFESITGIRIVKAFAAEIHELITYVQSRKKIEDITKVQTMEWHWYDFLRRFALNIILFGIYAYVIYWTFYGRFTIGEMTLLLQLVNQARFPLFAMSFILGQIQEASAGFP